MKRLKLFWMVVKRTHMDKLVYIRSMYNYRVR